MSSTLLSGAAFSTAALLSGVFAASVLSGCAYSEHTGEDVVYIEKVSIDTGVTIDADPGTGVAAYLTYQSGGLWELYTTCDTDTSGYACNWDIILSVPPGKELSSVEEVDLEPSDASVSLADGAVEFIVVTRHDFDRLVFETDPGQALRVDISLDGYYAPSFLVWSGYDALQIGAPTSPVDVVPSTP